MRGDCQCALGDTGIDIAALLARRDRIVADTALARPQVRELPYDLAAAATPTWSPLDQRQFFVRLAGKRLTAQEALGLLTQGFDLDEDAGPDSRIIASANDIKRLVALGHEVRVIGHVEQSAKAALRP